LHNINTPLVSIITVVYNRKNDLRSTIKSVDDQSFRKFEYIIIDGGSTDGSLDVIKENSHVVNEFVVEPDKGIYDAMNKGVRLAKGEWIIFMNAGDVFYDSRVLEFFSDRLARASDATIVYGDAEIVEGEKSHIQYQYDRHLDLTKSIIHQSMFIRRDFLEKHPYDLRYRIMADYDNLLSISAVSPHKCKHVDKIVCRYEKTGISSKPLYTYFREYYNVARHRMSALEFVGFNLYILPRWLWSLRLKK
jgi:glycosyltransferase involved in cell wall biosynthesis